MGIESVCTNNYFVAVFCPFLFSLMSFCASQTESFYRRRQRSCYLLFTMCLSCLNITKRANPVQPHVLKMARTADNRDGQFIWKRIYKRPSQRVRYRGLLLLAFPPNLRLFVWHNPLVINSVSVMLLNNESPRPHGSLEGHPRRTFQDL